MKKKVSQILAVLLFFTMLLTGMDFRTETISIKNGQNFTEDTGNKQKVQQTGKLEYIAVEKPYITTPDTQKIVAGFGEENINITSAELGYINTTTGAERTVISTTLSADGVVFEIPYTNEEAGVYQIKTLTYVEDDTSQVIILKNIGMDITYGVDREADTNPDAVVADNEVHSSDMNIVSFDSNGNQTSEESIESAIENAESDVSEEENSTRALKLTSNGNIIVVLDPGHDSMHEGTTANGLSEAAINLKIALACRGELQKYSGVEIYMTRESNACPYPGTESAAEDNANRVAFAASVGANVYVSIHCNSASPEVHGCEVYYPNGSYRSDIGQAGSDLADQVLSQLVALGIADRGTHIKNSKDNTLYPDGSLADYYGVIRRSKLAGFPAIIIEHGFQSSNIDVSNFLGTEEGCQRLGVADATAIANYFNLSIGSGMIYNGVDYEAVFNADYYYNHNADVAAAFGTNKRALLKHFVEYGMSEGRQATSIFNVQYYKSKYGDLVSQYGNELQSYYKHFIYYGIYEGRQGSSTFDVNSYRNQYADLRRVYGNTYKQYYLHYVYYGESEGRKGTGCAALRGAATVYNGINYAAIYNYNYYVNRYSDIRNEYGIDDVAVLAHFVNYGMSEGRQGNSAFDVNSYQNQYADIRRAYGSNKKAYYLHYIQYGKAERRNGTGCTSLQGAITTYNGVNYAAVYNYNTYITKNADIKKAYGSDDAAVLAHFVNYGMSEGRQGSSKFNVDSYRNQYADLRRAYGSNKKAYYLHYIQYGKAERRIGTGCTSLQGAITTYNGVNYAAVYNYNTYIAKNADIKKAYGSDDTAVLAHFVNYGMDEGRKASNEFTVQVYKSRYMDLQNVYGNNLKFYYLHFIHYGKSEGRTGI